MILIRTSTVGQSHFVHSPAIGLSVFSPVSNDTQFWNIGKNCSYNMPISM
jgi:hypothetical protein